MLEAKVGYSSNGLSEPAIGESVSLTSDPVHIFKQIREGNKKEKHKEL
ncbi:MULTISPECIES: hypothetical protein [unclassified Wolbachia]|nr:hypothetical protein [Wolbachia endosymbiont of Scaptomyza pallida]MDU8921087.1 hypothetical protein [Wolbachia endosymbiont of Scaptomyza pallida]